MLSVLFLHLDHDGGMENARNAPSFGFRGGIRI